MNKYKQKIEKIEKKLKKETKQKLKDCILTKIDKIAIASYVNNPLALKRINKSFRCFITFDEFCQLYKKYIDKDIIKILDTSMQHGIIVFFCNYDYFENKNSKDLVIKQLISRIGSNKNLSAIVQIFRYASTSCNLETKDNIDYNELINKLRKEIEKNKWIQIKKKIKQNKTTKNHKSNECWEGHYSIDTSGGTHKPIIEPKNKQQIVNRGKEYCNENMLMQIEYKLLYYLLCCKNGYKLLKSENKIEYKLLKKYYKYQCKNHNINIEEHIIKNKLVCGLTKNIITYDDINFKKIEMCHGDPQSNFKWEFNELENVFISNHNINNVFWGFKNANLFQGDMTIYQLEQYILKWALKINKFDCEIELKIKNEKTKNKIKDNNIEKKYHDMKNPKKDIENSIDKLSNKINDIHISDSKLINTHQNLQQNVQEHKLSSNPYNVSNVQFSKNNKVNFTVADNTQLNKQETIQNTIQESKLYKELKNQHNDIEQNIKDNFTPEVHFKETVNLKVKTSEHKTQYTAEINSLFSSKKSNKYLKDFLTNKEYNELYEKIKLIENSNNVSNIQFNKNNKVNFTAGALRTSEYYSVKGMSPPHADSTVAESINAYLTIVKKKYQLQDSPDYNKDLYNFVKNNNKKIKILWGNCLDHLKNLPSESIHLMVTSPPYYNARNYSIWENLQKYLDDMKAIIKECYRVLDNHRVFVFNISDIYHNDNMKVKSVWGKRRLPLPAYFINIFEQCGFTFVDDYIWDKGEPQSQRQFSEPYPLYKYPINSYEHILIFHKHRLDKTKFPCSVCGCLDVNSNTQSEIGLQSWECKNPNCSMKSKSNRGKRFSLKTILTQNSKRQKDNIISEKLIKMWRKDICKFSPVIKINCKGKNIIGHTAPFPPDIPEMAVQFYSYKNELVLDPFAGSMTSAIVANRLGRIGIGSELRKDLFKECIIKNIVNSLDESGECMIYEEFCLKKRIIK